MGRIWYEAAERNEYRLCGDQQESHPRLGTETQRTPSLYTRRNAARSEGNARRPTTGRRPIDRASLTNSRPTSSNSLRVNLVSPLDQHRTVTATMLRKNHVPWQISHRIQAVLRVANDEAGQQILELRSFGEGPFRRFYDRNDAECCICLSEQRDETVALKCGSCSFYAHLKCMEKWLGVLQPGRQSSCPQCRYEGGFDALFRDLRDVSLDTSTNNPDMDHHESGANIPSPEIRLPAATDGISLGDRVTDIHHTSLRSISTAL